MRTFAQTPKATRQATSAEPGAHGRVNFGQSSVANASLHLQRTLRKQPVPQRSQASQVRGEGDSATTQIDPCGHDFGRIPVHANRTLKLQTKLTVNTPGDGYEQEADRMANQVTASLPHPAGSGVAARIQRLSGPTTGQRDAAPASVDQVLATPGRPLESSLRQGMQQRFGHDFSQVRVHSGPLAEQSTREVSARAYTVGHDIVFGAGRFAPATQEGRWLIAHELTHVVQQSGAGQMATHRQPPSPGSGVPGLQPKAGIPAAGMILQRAPDPNRTETREPKVPERVRAFRRGLTHAQELRQIADKLIKETLGEAPKSLGARRRALARIAQEGGPQAAVAGRLGETLGKIEANLEQRARDVVSVADDLIEKTLGARPKTPEARESALRNLGKRGGEAGEAAGLLGKELGEINTELAARKPGSPTQFATAAKKPAGKVDAPVTKDAPGTKPPPSGGTAEVAVPQRGSGTPAIVQGGTRLSGVRTAGRFLAREAPGLFLQVALMALFPPGVNFGNHKAGELSRTKLDPAVHDALTKQQAVFDKLMAADLSKSIYANVTARLDYGVDAGRGGDLELSLKDITFLELKITNAELTLSDPKFKQTAPRTVAKQITYSILLYEPEHVTRRKAELRAQQEKAELERLRRQREADDAGWQRGFKQ